MFYCSNAQEPRLVLPIGHESEITSLFVTNDKLKVITGDDNQTFVWDIKTGRLLYSINEKLLDLSPINNYILTTSIATGLRFWSSKENRVLKEISLKTADVLPKTIVKARFNNDESKIVYGTAAAALIMYSIKTKEFTSLRSDNYRQIRDIIFLKDNRSFITYGIDGYVIKWNTDSLNKAKSLYKNAVGSIFMKAEANAEKTKLLIHTKEILVKYDLLLDKIDTIQISSNNIWKSIFNPYKNEIITLCLDSILSNSDEDEGAFADQKKIIKTSKIIISDGGTGDEIKVIKGEGYMTFGIDFHKYKTYIPRLDGTVIAYNLNWQPIDSVHYSSTLFDNIKSVNSKEGLLITTLNGEIYNFNISDMSLRYIIKSHTSPIYATGISDINNQFFTSTYSLVAWNIDNASLQYRRLNHIEKIDAIKTDKKGNIVATTALADSSIFIYDAISGKLLLELKSYLIDRTENSMTSDGQLLSKENKSYIKLELNDDGTQMLYTTSKNELILYDIKNKKEISHLKVNSDEEITCFGFDCLSKQIVAGTKSGKFFIQAISTPNDSKTVELFRSSKILSFKYSKDAKYIAISSLDSFVRIFETKNYELINSYKSFDESFADFLFTNDGKQMLLGSTFFYPRLKLVKVEENKIIRTLEMKVDNKVQSLIATNQLDQMIAIYEDQTASLFSLSTGKSISQFKPENKQYFKAYSPEKKCLLYTSGNQFFQYDIRNGKKLASYLKIDSTDYVVLTAKGYYQATPTATKLLHYVTKDLKVITFEQLDVKYNRPDKVLEAIGSTDTLLINSYRKAYQKRIKKLGIDTTQFKDGYSVPESDFINRDAIEYEQSTDKLTLKIKGFDSTYKLDRFNIWVNEVPLFGLRGKSIKSKNKNGFDTTISITLSQGENRIETSITNVNGTESYRMPLFVKYTPAIPKETKLHFIGIGINQFANPDYNLSWSVKDIHDLAIKLKSKYPNITIDTLFDKAVTKENILALKQKLLLLNEDDKVIISYSGHGVLSKEFDYFLSTYSINFINPEEKGLAYDDLESLLDNIKPRQKLMLIDACHSGEVDKDEIAKIEASKKELSTNGVTTKSSIKVIPKKNLGMANSFELMQSLFVNVGKGTGATIISAAGGMQYAQERGDLKNGVFTYSIIEAFNNNPTLKVSELKKLVGEKVTQLTNGLQKPTSRNETNNYDWVIW